MQNGICAYYVKETLKNIMSRNYIAGITLYYDGALLTPILSFLIFDRPHDCFNCLAKDPDRSYSSY